MFERPRHYYTCARNITDVVINLGVILCLNNQLNHNVIALNNMFISLKALVSNT